MEVVKIAEEIYNSGKRLENGSKEIFKYAKAMAEKERDYRRALTIEIMKLRDAKVPVSLINDVARGNLAELKFQRDLAEAQYKSCKDSLNAISTQMNGLQSVLKYMQDI